MEFGFSSQQSALYEEMRELGSRANGRDGDSLTLLAASGVLGLGLSRSYGGRGLDMVSTAHAFVALGEGLLDGGVLLAAGAHLFGVALTLQKVGTPSQCAHWLPRLADGSVVATVAATETGSGSNIGAVQAAVHTPPALATGHKAFVTSAARAGLFLFVGQSPERRGLSVALVPKGEGVQVGQPLTTIGLLSAELAPVNFSHANCELLGRPGAGMSVFQSAMTFERALVLAFRLGAMKRQLSETIAFVKQRRIPEPISKRQAVRRRMAEMQMRLECALLLTYKAAWSLDHGKRGHAEAALAKWHVAESALNNAVDAFKLHGGRAFMRGENLSAAIDDALGGTIHSGTEDVLAHIVASWLGL